MKNLPIIAGSPIIFLLPFLWFMTCSMAEQDPVYSIQAEQGGTAIIMTGASARLPQQAALLEELYDRNLLNDVVFISGVSAGAINAVMLNAILSKKITWDDYREILFRITNDDIYTLWEDNKLPVNSDPKRKLFQEIVEDRLGYMTIGDLPITTQISFRRSSSLGSAKGIYRIFSRRINPETDTTLSLVDILMATTAIPVVFQPERIRNVTTIPDVKYVDGGFGEDKVPYTGLLEFQKFRGKNVSKVYFISRKTGNADIGDELRLIGRDFENVKSLGNLFDSSMHNMFVKRLRAFVNEAPELLPCSYAWMPDFEENYLLLNFNKMTEQYMITKAWARLHDPVPLNIYLERNSKRNRIKP